MQLGESREADQVRIEKYIRQREMVKKNEPQPTECT